MKTQLILVVVTLAFLELVLQIVCFLSLDMRRLVAPPWQPTVIRDQRLVWRGNPLHREADAAGYRNASRLSQADIVVLGDSQAYGPEERDDSWPSVLGRLTKRSVYNMALPAYGPLQSYLQLDDALALRPKLVVVAPYFGNDFYDAFLVMQRDLSAFGEWVSPQLLAQALREEQARPIETEVVGLFRFGGAKDRAADPDSVVRRWVSENLKLYGFLRALKSQVQPLPVTPLLSRNLETAALGLTPDMKRFASVLEGPGWRTILTAPVRDRVLDDRDPRIRAGFEAAREAIHRIAQRCTSAGAKLLVVLIPTKELVFFPRIGNPAEHPRLRELVANEMRLRREWIDDLRSKGIRHVDIVPALSAAQTQPYPEDLDGHPTAIGHRIVADEIARHITDIAAATVR